MEEDKSPLEGLIGACDENEGKEVVAACAAARAKRPTTDAADARVTAARCDWPLTRWIAASVAERKQRLNNTVAAPLIVGVSGPQGCGKSTLCSALVLGLGVKGISAAVASLDDFYKDSKTLNPNPKPQTLNPNSKPPTLNPKPVRRGPPGTHDVRLCADVLKAIRNKNNFVSLPRYDKSANYGAGDRMQQSDIINAAELEVFLLEGWMLGFRSVSEEDIEEKNFCDEEKEELKTINEALKEYEVVHSLIDQWIIFEIEDPSWIYSWREQQEEDTRRERGSGLSSEEVKAFVDRFISLYRLYLPGLYGQPLAVSESCRENRVSLHLTLDKQRRICSATLNCLCCCCLSCCSVQRSVYESMRLL